MTVEQSGQRAAVPTTPETTRKPSASPTCRCDDADRDRVAGDHLDHDGEDDQAEHVVGDGGAEHDPRLDRRQRPEVAEDPGGDADAGRRQRGAEEDRRLRCRSPGPRPRRPRPTNGTATPITATSIDARPTRPSSARSISIPTCTSSSRTPSSASTPRLTPRSPPSSTRPSTDGPTDAGHDLAEHGGDPHALGALAASRPRR